MLNEERRQKIEQFLSKNKRLRVGSIANQLRTSEVTIRKDLEVLERRGVLTRVHGGAIVNHSTVTDLALTEKERIHIKQKQRIAQKAAEMISEGEVIILDSGSTTLQIARQIKFYKNLTIITNAVNIASELAASDMEIILTGGILREKSFSLVGPIAEEAMRNFTADKLFLGIDFSDLEFVRGHVPGFENNSILIIIPPVISYQTVLIFQIFMNFCSRIRS